MVTECPVKEKEVIQKQKVPFPQKLAFAIGDINGGGIFNIVNLFYAIFLTDVVRLNPLWVAPIMLIVRVYDALIDPFFGYITDRTNTKMGRRRPYLLIGAPFVAISFFLLFYPYNFESDITKFIAVLLSYLFLSTVQTVVMIPYSAFAGEISLDYKERTSINGLCLTFSLLSAISTAMVPMMIISKFTDIRKGYMAMSVFFGLLFGISVLITAVFSKEPKTSHAITSKLDFKVLFADPLSIKVFRQYLYMSLCTGISMAVMSVVVPYYMKYYIKREADLPILLGLMFFSQIVFLPLYIKMANKISKNKAYLISAVIWIIAGVCMFFIHPQTPSYLLFGLAVLMGAGISGAGMLPHSMFGDVADVGELKFNERREGSFSGFSSIIGQLASAIANALVMAILGIAGYLKPIEQIKDGVKVLVEQQQTDITLLVMRIILCVTPLVVMSIGIYIASRYRLSIQTHAELSAVLEQQRDGLDHKDLTENKQKLTDYLI